MRRTFVVGAVVALVATGCGGAGGPASPAASGTPTTTAVAPSSVSPTEAASVESSPATPTASPSGMTVKQFATIIAKNERDWRDVIDESFECRNTMVLGEEDDPLAQAKAYACILSESAMTHTATTAVKELLANEPPAEINELVASTAEVLLRIAAANVADNCVDDKSQACDDALVSALHAYTSLEKELDAWRVYS